MNQIINGERIYLRKLTKYDATETYKNWFDDNEITKYLETKTTSIMELKKFIDNCNKNYNCLLFGIFDKNNNNHIGNIKLEPINWNKKMSELGILIGNKQYWNKGFGYETMKTLIDYSFKILKLKEITLGVHIENINAIKLYNKLKFQKYDIKNKYIRMKLQNNIYS